MCVNAPADPISSWCDFARQVIESATSDIDSRQTAPVETSHESRGGVFVTLRKFKQLRGCMGTLDIGDSLAEAVRYAAISAALHDPRFPPVTAAELPDLALEVSILSPPWPMRNLDELELGRHGIIVRYGQQRGLFLPQVATDHHFDKETFLSRCCSEKAGLPPEAWRDPQTEVLLFTAQVYSESPDKPARGQE